jgi:hypothetical protein
LLNSLAYNHIMPPENSSARACPNFERQARIHNRTTYSNVYDMMITIQSLA